MHLQLDALHLAEVCAHGGEGRIGFHRLLAAHQLASACNFVDYAVLPPGASIGVHTHGDDEELYLVLEGEGTMHLDGREFAVGPGSVVKNSIRGRHGLRNTGTVPLRLFVVEIAARPAAEPPP